MADVFPFLQANPLLRGFTDDGIRIIQSIAVTRSLEPGMPVFVEKMAGESAFLLVDGEIALSVARHGNERDVGVLTAPDAFGELSLVEPTARRVTAKARTSVLLIELPRRDFQNLQQKRPQACLKLLMNITDRFARKSLEAAPYLEGLLA